MQYFSAKIRGSDGYWRTKKYELKAWIDHHIQMGHGPPTLFMTLSCAENWWIDLLRLLCKRVSYYDKELSKQIANGVYSARCKAARDHPLLVLEFFQKRVEIWFETVGKNVFKIKHWWGRYEFAPGRGQIHLHILCIADNMHVMKAVYNKRGNRKAQAEILSNYARETLGMTAEHPGVEKNTDGSKSFKFVSRPEGNFPRKQCEKSLASRCSECNDNSMDVCNLLNCVALHKCNNGCLRSYGR